MREHSSSIEASVSRQLFRTSVLAIVLAAILSAIFTLSEITSTVHPLHQAKVQATTARMAANIEAAFEQGATENDLDRIEAMARNMAADAVEINSLRVLMRPDEIAASKVGLNTTMEPAVGLPQEVRQAFKQSLALYQGNMAQFDNIGTDARHNDQVVARVVASVEKSFFRDHVESFFFDTLVVLLAVTLIALELLVVPRTRRIVEPLILTEDAIERRSRGDFAQYRTFGKKGLIPRFVTALNTLNGQLRDRVSAALDATRDVGETTRERLTFFASVHKLFKTDGSSALSVNDARIPLFVFCFAEELQKSFMPLFVAEYYREWDWFAVDIMVGLPISAFMFVIAFLTPFAGKLVDRYGNKRLFLMGLVPAAAGYVLCFLVRSGNDIVLARSLTAVGYAVITISCQSYMAAVVPKKNRARGMAIFVGVLMAATMCGTAIGGILATWMGFKPVFLVSAVLTLVAGGLGLSLLSGKLPPEEPLAVQEGGATSGFRAMFSNARFVMIVLFCAIPAKIILTGFLYLFVPIYLANLNVSHAEIGRIMMVYSLIIIPISPIASRASDRLGKGLTVVIVATVASGLVLTGLYNNPPASGVLIVVACLGLAHAFIKAPLIVSAMEAAEAIPGVTRTSVLSTLRTSERVGSVIGPTLVGAMLVVFDYGQTAAILGSGVALIGITFAVVMFTRAKTD